MPKKRLKIFIALIHNNNQKRLGYLRPHLDLLMQTFSRNFDTEIFEVSDQPKVSEQNFFITFFRKSLVWFYSRKLISYRVLQPRNIILDLINLVRLFLLTFLNKKFENKRATIDSFVTDKHLRAWMRFLISKGNFLICFEDDAVFKNESTLKLERILKDVINKSNQPVYIDLAGGMKYQHLKMDELELKKSGFKIYHKKPITNTACCYLINQLTANILITGIIRRPWLRLLSIDWLLNALFIINSKQAFFTFHTNPTILDHGSATGQYPSWL